MKTLTLFTLALSALSMESVYAACEAGDFVSSPESNVTIGIQGASYNPRCLKVRPGTTVTILASKNHPLQGVANPGGPANPFHRANQAEAPDTQRLTENGAYRYFCVHHGDAQGKGMAGTILVE